MTVHTPNFSFTVENFGGWNNGVSKFYYARTINSNEHIYAFSYNAAALSNLNTITYETIIYKTATSEWCDYDSTSNPWTLTTVSGVTTGTDQTGADVMKWGHAGYPDPTISSGPTVTSHYWVDLTENAKILTSDTVQSSDFTFLKGTNSYTPSSMNLIAISGGYVYDYQHTTTDWYAATIDSQPVAHFYYDGSWTSSPSSGRSTNSNRILNVLATIPSNTTIRSGLPLTTVFETNSRVIYHEYTTTINGVTTTIDIRFIIDNKIINNVSEIVGYFYETRTANGIPNAQFSSVIYVIGAQQTMTYTQSLSGVDTTFYVSDWIYDDEPEGDGYVAPVTTSSNGGGKPDRYPLIMTNLFNRNRSIYSIGMTHKDTWDLFL